MDNLKEIKASLEKQLQELKAYQEKKDLTPHETLQYLHDMLSNVYGYVQRVADHMNDKHNDMDEKFQNHLTNHAPALKTASQMQAYLKMVGAENDYNLVKPNLKVHGSKNHNIEIEFVKK